MQEHPHLSRHGRREIVFVSDTIRSFQECAPSIIVKRMQALFVNNLRAIRKSRGLTLQQVADALLLKSTNRISLWERGLLYPHVTNFLKLLKLYNIEAGDAYGVEATENVNEF